MPLTGAVMGATMASLRAAAGDNGSELSNFSGGLGQGVALSLVGVAFETADTGATSGAGVGTGTGLTVNPVTVADALYVASILKMGSQGPNLRSNCDDLGAAFAAEMAQCTLSSMHAPVFAGVGVVVPGSIAATPASIAAVLIPTGQGLGMLGPKWPEFAEAMAEGAAAGLATAVGQVTIAGAGGDPSAGTGSGTGTLS